MLLALVIEALFGWPDWLYRKIGHPVTWMGWLIARLEVKWNKPSLSHKMRYVLGGCLVCVLVGVTGAVLVLIHVVLPEELWWIEGLLASSLLASRSLYFHVKKVAEPLCCGDLEGAKTAVSMIVGRDPEQLDEKGVARAAIESLAENASDGVIAPLFWGALFGLPGIAGYKAINTLDSMIGHRNDRYLAFGGVAARLDDIANYIPARITGGLIVLACLSGRALKVMFRDAGKHRSINAGWPEAAMAGALNVRLSGPRVYGDKINNEPWLNEGAQDPTGNDIDRGLWIYVRAMALCAGGLALVAFAVRGVA